MDVSANGINLIKQFEGCRLTAYKDAVGVWTIGYGTTKGVTAGMVITQAKAEQLLKDDCAKFVSHVNTYQPLYGWNQNQFDALVCFAYNIGSITALTAKGTRSNAEIATMILAYNKAGGKVLSGLTKRRQAEHDLFLKPCEDDALSKYPTLKKGDSGEYVGILQNNLINLGFGTCVIDGKTKTLTRDFDFGPTTDGCVKLFQKAKGLTVDGIVGQATWRAF